jgi:hypothetical protein
MLQFTGSNAKGISFHASNQEITVTPDGASFQMFNNSSVTYPGQIFFDGGAHNESAIIWRTTTNNGIITERMRVNSLGNVGIGNKSPQVRLHVGNGGGGMGFPYEESIIERDGDTKFGVYTSVDSFGAGGSAIVLGATGVFDENDLYPGFEFQFSPAFATDNNYMRYNFLERDSAGAVVSSNTNIFKLYADNRISFQKLAGSGTRTVVADSNGFISAPPITKVYTAIISSTGGTPPTVDAELENTIGSVTYSVDVGASAYILQSTGNFPASKTYIAKPNCKSDYGVVNANAYRVSDDEIYIELLQANGGQILTTFSNLMIEVRIYN